MIDCRGRNKWFKLHEASASFHGGEASVRMCSKKPYLDMPPIYFSGPVDEVLGLLFLQLIMRKLRRPPKPGRAGVVVPNGTLFGDGVCARIKEDLLKNFNLHTIVRLPNGVFAPYTSIPTNLLFFDRSSPTKEIWYYEQPLPEGRKNYTKTKPLQYEEFADCVAWWDNRQENDRAWRVKVADVLRYDENGALLSVNLDIKNPNTSVDLEHLPPEKLVEDILRKENRIAEILQEIRAVLGEHP